jgi:putative transposase
MVGLLVVHGGLHHNLTSLKEANEIIENWIRFYNEERRHSALKYKTSVKAYRLAV